MVRKFEYGEIRLIDIENNPQYIYKCDADKKEIIIDKEND